MELKYFEHKDQQMALEELKRVIYFTKEVEFVCTEIEEKLKVPDLLGKTVKVTEKQFPEVYKILVKQAKIAEIEIPDTFVYEDFYYGVESKGTTKPWIEISAKTIQDLKSEEIEFLISREMYNIKNGITYYRSIFEQLIKVIESGSWIVGVDTLIKTMKLKMCHWNRLTHFSADCYGYLMNKNIVICINSILKLVLNSTYLSEEIDIFSYIEQASEINLLDDIVYNYTKLDEMVPYGPYRVNNLIGYASSKNGILAIKNMK